jgi:hypothetical protein
MVIQWGNSGQAPLLLTAIPLEQQYLFPVFIIDNRTSIGVAGFRKDTSGPLCTS